MVFSLVPAVVLAISQGHSTTEIKPEVAEDAMSGTKADQAP